MAEIKNTFLKGKMNQDLDARLIPSGEYREAINLSISRSEGSTVGEFENILGNTVISNLEDTGVNVTDVIVIGYFVDESNNVVYCMATNSVDSNYILKIDLSVSTLPVILVQGEFLNFNSNYRITGINVIEDFLFWTDNYNQPRKINITKPLGYYTTEDQISVAKYDPFKPILALEKNTTTVTGASLGSNIIVPNSFSGISVGDIITNNDKIGSQNITELVTVISIDGIVSLTLSKSVIIPDGTLMDFSRPSMTNQSSKYMSNHLSGSVTISGSDVIIGPSGDLLFDGKNGIPRIGDLVSCINDPAKILADTRVASVEVIDISPVTVSQQVTVTLTKPNTLVNGDTVSISDNPDYDPNWKGDSDWLEDKFVRFSYRFKFKDNEYSLIAPWSQAMFIPKQYSEFGGGLQSSTLDMDNAYKSTILAWFENNIDNILLRIPMPYDSIQDTIDNLHVSEIDIIYKESDALAAKVLETIELTNQTLTSINYNDVVHGDNLDYYLDYDYSSTKPYKTLPNNQLLRVSDKVPVKALAQEIIGNRVVYGNYLDRHTAPDRLPFSASAQNKSIKYDNYTQYPKHTLKQNRTYQVGFVLSDRYGRQSDVILSSYDSEPGTAGSTVFHPYNSLEEQTTNPVINWLGDVLTVQLDQAIATTDGPGIYNGDVNDPNYNPLGWYSYKIVVKQQEQEYYNVYLPGFVNGYPVIGINERNQSFFCTLIGDNINKIPRDLNEVGPNDRDYSSSEVLSIRVNNPLIDNKTVVYPKDKPWNTQYYPDNMSQDVVEISSTRDMEIAAIPFEPNVLAGDYGQTGTTAGPPAITTLIGSIPWGTTGPDPSLYNTDANPLVMRGSSAENGENTIGAYVTTNSVNGTPPLGNNVFSMVPFLSVAETKPVYSLLDIYWETSLSGELSILNSLVDSQYGGLTGSNFLGGSFLESDPTSTVIGNDFNFTDGAGNVVSSGVTISSISVVDSNGNQANSAFTVVANGGGTAFQVKTNQEFFYSDDQINNPRSYTITVNTLYNSLNDSITIANVNLSNVAPNFTVSGTDNTSLSCPTTISGLDTRSVVISELHAVNGTTISAEERDELVFSLNPDQADFSTIQSQFRIVGNQLEVNKPNGYTLVDNQQYNVSVRVTDVNGNGLFSNCTFSFLVGAAAVPEAIANGWQNSSNIYAYCGDNLEVQFLNSSTIEFRSSLVVDGITYPSPQTGQVYNVLAEASSGSTGALSQGAMTITGTLTSTISDAIVDVTIQKRSGLIWVQAVDSNGVTINNISLVSNSVDSFSKTFDSPGEYRLISNIIGDNAGVGVCTGTVAELTIDFGDANP